MMATELQKQEPKQLTVQERLEERRGDFEQALQGSIDSDYFLRAAITLYSTASPRLREASFNSFGRALMQCAQLGLSPDPQLGEFYLIPRYNKDQQCIVVTPQIGYLGLLKRARRLPDVANIDADVVREGDEFVFRKGTTVEVTHVPLLSAKARNVLASYAVAFMRSGPPMVVLCDRYAIQGARERSESESKPSSPWNTDFAAMAKKTAVRRLCKLLPLDDQLRQYVQAEEHDERDTTPLGAIDVEASEPEAIGTVRRSRIFDARDNGPPDDPPPPEGEFDDYDPTSEGAP